MSRDNSWLWQWPVAPSPAPVFGSILHGAIKQLLRDLAHHVVQVDCETVEAILRKHRNPIWFSDPVQERKCWEMGRQQLAGVWTRIA